MSNRGRISRVQVPENTMVYHALGGPDTRGIVSTKTFSPGEVICRFIPEVQVLNSFKTTVSNDYRANCCGYCNKPGTNPARSTGETPTNTPSSPNSSFDGIEIQNDVFGTALIVCPTCSLVKYCSQDCLTKDRTAYHGKECAFFQKYYCGKESTRIVPITETRLLLRMLIYCSKSKSNYHRILYLTSHKDKFVSAENAYGSRRKGKKRVPFNPLTLKVWENATQDLEILEKFKSETLTTAINGYMQDLDLKNLVGVMLVNNAILHNTFMEPSGLIFDPFISLLNHSCEPNVVLIHEKNEVRVCALKSVIEGEQLYITYCYSSSPKFLRSFDLGARYFFECNCRACSRKTDRFFSFNCPACQVHIPDLFIEHFLSENSKDMRPPSMCQSCLQDAKAFLDSNLQNYIEIFDIYCKNVCSSIRAGPKDIKLSEKAKKTIARSKRHYTFEEMLELKKLTAYDENEFRDMHSVERADKIICDFHNSCTVPLYIFPLPQIIFGLTSHYETTKQHAKHIKYLFLSNLFVRLASDSSPFKAAHGHSLRELALKLFTVAVEIHHELGDAERKQNLTLEKPVSGDVIPSVPGKDVIKQNLMNDVAKTSLFCALNAYKALVYSYTRTAPIVLHTKNLIHTMVQNFSHDGLGNHLEEWLSTGVTNKKFDCALKGLCKAVHVVWAWNDRIPLSNRVNGVIFGGIPYLPLKEFGIMVGTDNA